MMSDYREMAKRQRKWMYVIIVMIAIGSFVLPYEYFFYGLLLGAAISFYNLWLLQRRTELLGDSAEKYGKRKGVGTASRLAAAALGVDRKSTRLNSSHVSISYAVFCLKKK